MAYKPNKRKKLSLRIGAILAIGASILIIGILVRTKVDLQRVSRAYEKKAEEFSQRLQQRERFVYVAKEDIPVGKAVTADMVSYEKGYSSMEHIVFADSVEGSIACVAIQKGTQLLGNMLTENAVTKEREEEFQVFYLSGNLKTYDVVDIRILYPNGENYIVLSKKVIKELDADHVTCYLWLDEQETLLISSAIVDAYQTPGATLYTTKYIDGQIQDASIVTYVPSCQVIDLIEKNPNILKTAKLSLEKEVRKSLELRLEGFVKEKESEEKAFRDYLHRKDVSEEETPEEKASEEKASKEGIVGEEAEGSGAIEEMVIKEEEMGGGNTYSE